MSDVKYESAEIKNLFNSYRSAKSKIIREWRLIRSLYKGDFWEVFKDSLDDFALTPDWNYFDYCVQAYQNSIYSGAFIGTLAPTRLDDNEYVDTLNSFISYKWNDWGMKEKFLHVGENGELYNLGAVRVDWNSKNNSISLKELSSDEVYLDPNCNYYKEGHAIFIERSIDINTLANDERFEKKVKEYIKKKATFDDKTKQWKIEYNTFTTSDNKMVSFVEGFIKNEEGTIDQIFLLDEAEIIYQERLTLNEFPVAIFQPSKPEGNPYGNSKLVKIMNTVITLNIIDSIEATQPYRVLNRPRIVNAESGINTRAFSEYGNVPGTSFTAKGDVNNVVKYVDTQVLPDTTNLKTRLENSIFQVTGVDPYYKGRMTNSIQTTGATQAFQARVTMLTDNSRITMLEKFCEDITRIVVKFYESFSKGTEFDVPIMSTSGTNKVKDIKKLKFNPDVLMKYQINATILLPMNQANLFESAKALYEMQGQYQFKTQVITEEDLIRWSDFPQKDLILQRIVKDKQNNTAQDLIADLTNFSSIFTKLLASGQMDETTAAQQAIQMLIEEKNAMIQDPTLGRGFE